jgi:hypothetical protein
MDDPAVHRPVLDSPLLDSPVLDSPVLDDPVLDEVISLLGSFLRATDALTRAINDRNGVGMCDALERLALARTSTLALVDAEPVAV